ncbi:MAG: type II toxin-antitoxin system VapC family toxin [Chloroflexota bacterium]
MTDKLFLDTAFAIALISPKDIFHDKAMALSSQIRQGGIHMLTTRAILIEIGNSLAKANTRQAAIEMLESIEADDGITIVPMTEELYKESFKFFGSRMDKEWGLVDCISFVVMQKFELTEALTSDRHFEQAGFIPLMR